MEIAAPYRQQTDPTVLVVDDDAEICQILHRMLSKEHYSVHISQSVAEATKAVEERLFDLYMLDYNLVDGTGFDVARDIRSKGSQAPIILLSGCDPASVAEMAEELHVFDILSKPFSRTMITNAVKNAIESPKVLAGLAKALA
jgi:DNA-binding NtrC family response regulator